ncbi:MAG: hypothetical protein U1D00_01100 [Mycobacterium sp.]|nr:hypothetical protein [Mycobacterium sp.]
MTFDNPVWGSPGPTPQRWGARESAVAVAMAAVIACLGGAAIYAATDQPSPAIGPPGHQAFDPASGAGPAVPGHPGGPPRQTPP